MGMGILRPVRVNIMVNEDEKSRWLMAAVRSRQTLSEWMRTTLHKAVDRMESDDGKARDMGEIVQPAGSPKNS
jgi:hypothetical protein